MESDFWCHLGWIRPEGEGPWTGAGRESRREAAGALGPRRAGFESWLGGGAGSRIMAVKGEAVAR